MEIEQHGGASVVSFGMNEEDVRLHHEAAVGRDGQRRLVARCRRRHRAASAQLRLFPRKIGYYAIAEKVIRLEQAIRSASGLPADILKLPERGYLKAGYFADVVVFDPKTFRDTGDLSTSRTSTRPA